MSDKSPSNCTGNKGDNVYKDYAAIGNASDFIDLCYGFECNAKATEKIEVNAGTFGKIILMLCSSCITKFR